MLISCLDSRSTVKIRDIEHCRDIKPQSDMLMAIMWYFHSPAEGGYFVEKGGGCGGGGLDNYKLVYSLCHLYLFQLFSLWTEMVQRNLFKSASTGLFRITKKHGDARHHRHEYISVLWSYLKL